MGPVSPICRMPLGQSQDILQADPGGRVTPRFWHRLNRFRHFCGGSLALASLDRACRNLVPAFPQRSPPRLLTAAACGGLRSAPDCRTRRALLHLSYSCAPPILMTAPRDTRPKAVIGRIEIPQRSSLLLYRSVLPFRRSTGAISSETPRVIRLIFKPVKWALFA